MLPFDVTFLRTRRAVRRVTYVAAAFALAGAVYAFAAPKWYRSVLTVVPAGQPKTSLSGLLGTAAGATLGLDSSLGASADANRIAAVLQSVAVTDAVVAKFDLRKRYRERYQEDARNALWRHCEVRTVAKPNLVELSCEDKDPEFVQRMLGFLAEYGNQVFRRVNVGSASEEVAFLEKRVDELRRQAEAAAARMRDFQEQYKIVDLDTQAKAVVSALASLNNQRISKQLELEYGRTFSARDETTMRQLRSQLAVIDDSLRGLEAPLPVASEPTRSAKGALFPAAMAVPRLRAEYETLFRDRKVAEATLIFALERLENAQAAAARDVSTFLVLDPPTVPTRKSRPNRLMVVFEAVLLGVLAGVTYEWAQARGGVRKRIASLFVS